MLKPGGRLVLVDSLQRGDHTVYEGLLELFPQNYHEPYFRSYTNEDFSALALGCGLHTIAYRDDAASVQNRTLAAWNSAASARLRAPAQFADDI